MTSLFHPFFRYSRATKVSGRIYSNLATGFRFYLEKNRIHFFETGYSTVRIFNKPEAESIYELMYSKKLNSIFVISLGYQYLEDLGGEQGSAEGLLIRLRSNMNWNFSL